MIKTPKGDRTRPTQARLRQALFNSLQSVISGARVLDLFAGSGGLGFEALSWGAAQAVFVEDSRPASKLIEANAADLGVRDRVEVIHKTVEQARTELLKMDPFDIILADPPYAGGWEMKLLETFPWSELLAEGGYFCLEWGAQKSQIDDLPASPPLLVKVREKNYGDSILTTYKRS
jgi:16S rRNA (guanine966-N2)-methyltransferase